MDQGLLYLILLIIASGSFSGSEVALTSLNKAKIRTMAEDGRFASKSIIRLKEHPQRVLITILIGNQVVNVLATVVATIWGIHSFGEEKIGLVTFVFTLALILFGTIGPKTLALRFPEIFARVMAYPLRGLIFIVRPVIWIFEMLFKGIIKVLKIEKKQLPSISEREIEAMLDISTEEGVVAEGERELMKHILKFSETQVESIMTLRKDVEGIEINIDKKDLINLLMESTHSHFPIYEEDLNNIKGIIGPNDIVSFVHRSRKKKPLADHKFKPVIMVPRTASLIELFKEFKEKKQSRAIVVDEHGQTIGLVTLENILEEMAGGTIDETNGRPKVLIEKKERNQWAVHGEATIGEINEALEIELEYPPHQTISLLILEELQRFPKPEEKVEIDGIEVEIIKSGKKTIDKVMIKKKPQTDKKKKE